MGEVIHIPTEQNVQHLFEDYVKKAEIAQKTLSPHDGITAGQAWGRFMQTFEGCTNE